MNLQPLSDRILIKVHENSDMSEGGIYTGAPTTTFVTGADTAIQKTQGTVISFGKGKFNSKGKRRAPDVSVGDFVCFSDTAGQYVDDEHVMIREQDVAFFMDKLESVPVIYN